jgi:hypothetical protein
MADEKKQHVSPCAACAFLKTCTPAHEKPEVLGGSSVLTYIGQMHGPFWIPCHKTYDQSIDDHEEMKLNPCNRECAGAAIMRANTGDDQRLPKGLLHLPPDKDSVFATYEEFWAHHFGVPLEMAALYLKQYPPDLLLRVEMNRAGVRRVAHLLPPNQRET